MHHSDGDKPKVKSLSLSLHLDRALHFLGLKVLRFSFSFQCLNMINCRKTRTNGGNSRVEEKSMFVGHVRLGLTLATLVS